MADYSVLILILKLAAAFAAAFIVSWAGARFALDLWERWQFNRSQSPTLLVVEFPQGDVQSAMEAAERIGRMLGGLVGPSYVVVQSIAVISLTTQEAEAVGQELLAMHSQDSAFHRVAPHHYRLVHPPLEAVPVYIERDA